MYCHAIKLILKLLPLFQEKIISLKKLKILYSIQIVPQDFKYNHTELFKHTSDKFLSNFFCSYNERKCGEKFYSQNSSLNGHKNAYDVIANATDDNARCYSQRRRLDNIIHNHAYIGNKFDLLQSKRNWATKWVKKGVKRQLKWKLCWPNSPHGGWPLSPERG